MLKRMRDVVRDRADHRRARVREVKQILNGRRAGGVVSAAASGDDGYRRYRSSGPTRSPRIGSVAAVQGVTVSADLPGPSIGIAFRTAGRVREGGWPVDRVQEAGAVAAAREAPRQIGLRTASFGGCRGC